MSHSIDSLCNSIKRQYKQEADEIERTVPTRGTCLNYNGMCEGRCDPCKEFIPKDWKSHIYFCGEWWS